MNTRQQGMVLLVSLVLLLMLTIIAITAASQSNLQLRISSNNQQQNVAFQAAESGLQRWANQYFQPGSGWHPNVIGNLNASGAITYEAAPLADTSTQIPILEGSGMSQGLYVIRFDVVSTGQACDNDGNCGATATHRQGLQNRYIP